MYKAILNTPKFFLLVLLFWVGLFRVCAQTQAKDCHVELLTCSPGSLVYELYGHTALRVTDGKDVDLVFNYGVFNFGAPHFLWNFVLGKTDYMVQPLPFALFMQEYIERGSSVTSQRLNLTPRETELLIMRLQENARPENREYRYNFFTNNCTTRVRDMIESCIEGELMYNEVEKLTARECLHRYTMGHPWAELGDDMLLGANVDTVLSDRDAAFLPERLMDFYAKVSIYDLQGNFRPFVLGDPVVLLQKKAMPVEPEFPVPPMICILCLAGLCLLVMACEFYFKRMFWGFDALLMLAHGACGLFLTFMFLVSEHPTVDSNWQVWLFNPLPLFCMPWVVISAIKHRRCLYHLVNLTVLVLFLVFSPWIPQQFAIITLPLACILLTRPMSYQLAYSRGLVQKSVKTKTATKQKTKKSKK